MSSKNAQYDLICASFNESMKMYVNEAMQDGWEPVGGVAISGNHMVSFYCQAMIKKEVKETKS